jgi:hypothetical protein
MLIDILVPEQLHLPSIEEVQTLLIIMASLIASVKDVWSLKHTCDS